MQKKKKLKINTQKHKLAKPEKPKTVNKAKNKP